METVTRGQRNFLLFLLAVIIVVVSVVYIAKPNFEDREEIESEKSERQTYYNDLKAKDKNRDQYIADTAMYQEAYEGILTDFPSEVYQENIIMYLQGIKDEYDFDFPDVEMGQEILFYTLGSGAVGDASLDADTEVATDEDGNIIISADAYNCYVSTFPVTYAGSYEAVKDVIDYIENSDFRMTVDSIDIAFNEETGDYEGELTFSAYAVDGGDRTTDQVDVNVQTGTDNIFGNPTVKTIETNTTDSAE